MVSIEECKTILNQNGNTYTNEQVTKIKEYLYQLAKIDIEYFLKSKTNEKQ